MPKKRSKSGGSRANTGQDGTTTARKSGKKTPKSGTRKS
jgi:hypothetical protein